MLQFLLDLLFPRFCLGCHKLGKYFCEKCVVDIKYMEPQVCPYCELPSLYGFTHPRCQKAWGLDGMFVLAHYTGIIREAIKEIKYQKAFAISDELAALTIARYHAKYNFDYLVPVPLSKSRECDRGFNQARKLAEGLVKNLKTGIVAEFLIRTKDTKPQFDLAYEERKQNMLGVFALNSKLKITDLKNCNFCLVDDVATTGATIFECAKVLKRAGAGKVFAICIARGN